MKGNKLLFVSIKEWNGMFVSVTNTNVPVTQMLLLLCLRDSQRNLTYHSSNTRWNRALVFFSCQGCSYFLSKVSLTLKLDGFLTFQHDTPQKCLWYGIKGKKRSCDNMWRAIKTKQPLISEAEVLAVRKVVMKNALYIRSPLENISGGGKSKR